MKADRPILIIPTFNTCDELKKLLSLIRLQTLVPDILVVDNASTDGTYDYLKKSFGLKLVEKTAGGLAYLGILDEKVKIIYLRGNSNLGCGGGLAKGQKYAYKLGYKYQILTDSDAYPISRNLIKELTKNTDDKTACVPINNKISRYYATNSKRTIKSFQFHYLTLTREMVAKVGYVSDKYFIQFDDFDYTSRISRNFALVQLTSVKFEHPKGLSAIFNAGSHRIYYYNRNVMIYYNSYKMKFYRIRMILTYSFYGLFFCNPAKIPLFEYYMLLTIYDGLRNRAGYRNIQNIKQEKLQRVKTKKPACGAYLAIPEKIDMRYLKGYIFIRSDAMSLLRLFWIAIKYKNLIINDYPTMAEHQKLMLFILLNKLYVYENGTFYKFKY